MVQCTLAVTVPLILGGSVKQGDKGKDDVEYLGEDVNLTPPSRATHPNILPLVEPLCRAKASLVGHVAEEPPAASSSDAATFVPTNSHFTAPAPRARVVHFSTDPPTIMTYTVNTSLRHYRATELGRSSSSRTPRRGGIPRPTDAAIQAIGTFLTRTFKQPTSKCYGSVCGKKRCRCRRNPGIYPAPPVSC